MEKFSAIVRALYDRTKSGALQWEESNIPAAFEVSFANSALRLRQTPGDFGEYDYNCSVINSSGEIVDNFSDEELREANFEYNGQSAYQVMGTIFDSARRQVTGADAVLDEVIRELGAKY